MRIRSTRSSSALSEGATFFNVFAVAATVWTESFLGMLGGPLLVLPTSYFTMLRGQFFSRLGEVLKGFEGSGVCEKPSVKTVSYWTPPSECFTKPKRSRVANGPWGRW